MGEITLEESKLREIRKISQLTGHDVNTVLAYYKMKDWGLSPTEAATVARLPERLGLVAFFYSRETGGLNWWVPRLRVEATLLVSLTVGLGYVLTYVF